MRTEAWRLDRIEQSRKSVKDGSNHRPASAAASCISLDLALCAVEAIRLCQAQRALRAVRREQAGAG